MRKLLTFFGIMKFGDFFQILVAFSEYMDFNAYILWSKTPQPDSGKPTLKKYVFPSMYWKAASTSEGTPRHIEMSRG